MTLPKVSIIIPTHLNESQCYLDSCLESALKLNGIDAEIIVTDTCIEPARIPDHPSITRYRLDHSVSGPAQVNYGISKAREESQYFILGNDDLIFSESSVYEMCVAAQDNDVLINPMSNCDNGWIYCVQLVFTHEDGHDKIFDKRFYTHDEVRGFEKSIQSFPRGHRILLAQQALCMYATLIPRKTLNRIGGGYDEKFIMGYADSDISVRANRAGIPMVVCMSAFIFHFGGVSTNKTNNAHILEHDKEYFKKKWGFESEHQRI